MQADSTNGYILKFQIYVGKKKGSECGLSERIEKDLMRKLKYKNMLTVTTVSCFPPLFRYLLSMVRMSVG